MGIPTIGYEKTAEGSQSCTRLKNVKKGNDGILGFDVRLTQPNDSWCNYTWWTPVITPNHYLPWMIVLEGHFHTGAIEFDVSSRSINGRCSYQFYRHLWHEPWNNLNVRPAFIAQTQSYNDPRFVSFRSANNINAIGVTIYIQLHNYDKKYSPRLGDCRPAQYLSHYDNNRFRQAYTIDYETVSIFGFQTDVMVSCVEDVSLEARNLQYISSLSHYAPFYWSYETVPAVFGMINSFSGGDSITVRAFNKSTLGVHIVAQEDRCDKESTVHIASERAALLVIGITNSHQQISPTQPYINTSPEEFTVIENACCNIRYHEESVSRKIPNTCSSCWTRHINQCRESTSVHESYLLNITLNECKERCVYAQDHEEATCNALNFQSIDNADDEGDNKEITGDCQLLSSNEIDLLATCTGVDAYDYNCALLYYPSEHPTPVSTKNPKKKNKGGKKNRKKGRGKKGGKKKRKKGKRGNKKKRNNKKGGKRKKNGKKKNNKKGRKPTTNVEITQDFEG
mmetsp:Transcript_9934/g.10038  ORF Transcript_9934/g.10038 Transcript_9934/m.10038 type:complete len:510 (-) Transcript_9934:188-1717(-)